MDTNLTEFLVDWLNFNADTAFDLLEHMDIRVSKDNKYPTLYNLKYGTIMADKASLIVRACRGAVVEKMQDRKGKSFFELRAYAFDRFFNIGESFCHELDWGNARVYEKYDGSLIKLFEYNGEWLVSTSGTVSGSSSVGDSNKSFSDLFWEVFEMVGYSKEALNPDICYIFELCHRANRIVVDYKEPQLPLLAARDRTQGFRELNLEEFGASQGFRVAQSYEFGDEEAVKSAVNGRGADFEGFILFDGAGRCKVKSDMYCQLHRVRGNGTPDFSELFLGDDLDEFLLHFPEYEDEFRAHTSRLSEIESKVNFVVDNNKELSQKEFAKVVFNEVPEASGSCFSIRSGKFPNFKNWLESLTPKKLDVLLGID